MLIAIIKSPPRLVAKITTFSSGGGGGEPYDGEYTVTPTNLVQILNTANKVLAQNVRINPIPRNYGLITYNGSTITVS